MNSLKLGILVLVVSYLAPGLSFAAKPNCVFQKSYSTSWKEVHLWVGIDFEKSNPLESVHQKFICLGDGKYSSQFRCGLRSGEKLIEVGTGSFDNSGAFNLNLLSQNEQGKVGSGKVSCFIY